MCDGRRGVVCDGRRRVVQDGRKEDENKQVNTQKCQCASKCIALILEELNFLGSFSRNNFHEVRGQVNGKKNRRLVSRARVW